MFVIQLINGFYLKRRLRKDKSPYIFSTYETDKAKKYKSLDKAEAMARWLRAWKYDVVGVVPFDSAESVYS